MSGLSIFEKMSQRACLEVSPAQCLRLRHKKSSCRLCMENCPTGAISFDESLEIDNSLCPGCGICAKVCPTDVFELRDLPYELLLARVKGERVVEFTCSLLPQEEGGLTVPCLGYLDEAVLVGAIAGGAQAVNLNVSQCKKCDRALGLRLATKSLKRANRILALFGIPKKISATAEEPSGNYSPIESELSSRREFFSYFKKQTQSLVASAIDSTSSEESPRTKVSLKPILPKKRSLLLEHLTALGTPVTDRAKAGELPFARVEIGDRCDGCGMCATFCPTGALRSYAQKDKQVIDFNLGYCLDCNLCSDVCPENAIAFSTYLNPHDLATTARTVLVEHRKSICSQCRQPSIVVSGSDLCLNCRKKKGMEDWLVAKIGNA